MLRLFTVCFSGTEPEIFKDRFLRLTSALKKEGTMYKYYPELRVNEALYIHDGREYYVNILAVFTPIEMEEEAIKEEWEYFNEKCEYYFDKLTIGGAV